MYLLLGLAVGFLHDWYFAALELWVVSFPAAQRRQQRSPSLSSVPCQAHHSWSGEKVGGACPRISHSVLARLPPLGLFGVPLGLCTGLVGLGPSGGGAVHHALLPARPHAVRKPSVSPRSTLGSCRIPSNPLRGGRLEGSVRAFRFIGRRVLGLTCPVGICFVLVVAGPVPHCGPGCYRDDFYQDRPELGEVGDNLASSFGFTVLSSYQSSNERHCVVVCQDWFSFCLFGPHPGRNESRRVRSRRPPKPDPLQRCSRLDCPPPCEPLGPKFSSRR